MTRNILKGIAASMLIGACVLVSAPKSEAAFFAYVCNDAACLGGDDVIVEDNMVGDATPLTAGGIVTNGTLAGYTFAINISASKPLVGSAAEPKISLSYLASGGTAPLYFYASDTDFTGVVSLNMVANASAGTSFAAAIYGGNSNTAFDRTVTLDSLGPVAVPTGDQDLSTAQIGAGINPYSLTIGVVTAAANNGTASGDLTMIPEPASLSLFGLGLAGLAGLGRRRARR